jgi:hypothetical protein
MIVISWLLSWKFISNCAWPNDLGVIVQPRFGIEGFGAGMHFAKALPVAARDFI